MNIFKYKTIALVLIGLVCFVIAKSKLPKSHGAPLASTGAPGELTCAQSSCHDSNAAILSNGEIDLSFSGVGNVYSPNAEYAINLAANVPGIDRFGFQIVALRSADDSNVGTWILSDPLRTQELYDEAFIDRSYMTHSTAGTMALGSGQTNWDLIWKAPSSDLGDVTFYVAIVAADYDGQRYGDAVYYDSFTIGGGGGCGLPMSITGAQGSSYAVELDWTASTCSTYELELQEVGGALQTYTTNGNSYTVSGLINNTDFNARVSCSCEGGTLRSDWTPVSTTCPPSPVASVNSTGLTSADLSWDLSTCQEVELRYRPLGAATFVALPASGTSLTVNGLSPGTEYEFIVDCHCGMNVVSSSLESFSTMCDYVPNIDVEESSSVAEISWDDGAGCSGFQVMYRELGAGSYQSQASSSSPAMISGLSPDTDYEVYVDCDCTGSSISSPLVSFSTICAVEAEPSPTSIQDQSAVIAWDDNPVCSSYAVKYRPVGQALYDAFVTIGGEVTLDDLYPETEYELTVKCTCGNTWVESDPLFFTTSACDYMDITYVSVDDPTSTSPLLSFQLVNNHPGNNVTANISSIGFSGPFSVSSSYTPNIQLAPGAIVNLNTLVTASNPSPGSIMTLNLEMGDGSAEDFNCSASKSFDWSDNGLPPAPANGYAKVKLRAYLGGPYIFATGKMSTALNGLGLLPLSQPYNIAPYYYTGQESVNEIPANVVDWVLVEVLNSNKVSIGRKAGFISETGDLLDSDGTEGITVPQMSESESYYFVIRHRSHLDIMTKTVHVPNNTSPYDLRYASNVSQGSSQMRTLQGGQSAMIPGEGNGDGIKSYFDFSVYAQNYSAIYELLQGDFNMDGLVTVSDYNAYKQHVNVIGIPEVRY